MTAINSPGSLGNDVPFASGATIDSALYTPRNGAMTVTLTAIPTRAGTFQPFLRTIKGDKALTPAASALVINELGIVQINYAISGLGSVFVRFINTDAAAGTCSFAATDGGGR